MNRSKSAGRVLSPYGLSGREKYRQAGRLWSLRKVLAPGMWSADAWNLPVRLHVWVDGSAMARTAVWCEGKWSKGPALTYQDTLKGAPGLRQALFRLAADGVGGRKVRGVGLILHVADEFAVTPVQPGVDQSPEDVRIAMFTVLEDPGAVVLGEGEGDLAEHVWRVIPTMEGTPKAGAWAVKMSRERTAWLTAFERFFGDQIPFRIAVVSAPLGMFAALPGLIGRDGTAEKAVARVAVLYYARFTALFSIAADGRLAGLSALPHFGRQTPQGFADRIRTEVQNLAGADPVDVILVKASPGVDVAVLVAEMTRANANDPAFFGDLDISVIEIGVAEVAGAVVAAGGDGAFMMLEMVDWTGAGTAGFDERRVAVCRQNFFGDDIFFGRALPDAGEMRLIALAKVVRVGMVVALMGFGLAWGLELFGRLTGPAWGLDPEVAAASEERAGMLRDARAAMDSWGAWAERPPSQAWSVVEVVSRLLPDGAGVVLTAPVEYTGQLERVRLADGTLSETVGVRRTWQLKGLSQGTSQTPLFEQVRVQRIFEDLGELAGCEAYLLGEGDEVRVSGSLERLSAPVAISSGATYDHGFTATIIVSSSGSPVGALPARLVGFPGVIAELVGGRDLAAVGEAR